MLPVLVRINWCFESRNILFQQRQSFLARSAGLQVFSSDEWDKKINKSRPLARCTGSLRKNHNHSTFTIKPQFICRQMTTLDGQIAQGYWMKIVLFMVMIFALLFLLTWWKSVWLIYRRKFSFSDILFNTEANDIELTKMEWCNLF